MLINKNIKLYKPLIQFNIIFPDDLENPKHAECGRQIPLEIILSKINLKYGQ